MKVRPSQAISRTNPSSNPLQARVTDESGVRQMMQKLEKLEHDTEHGSGHTGHNRWMVHYADLLTLLLGLFLVLFASSQKPEVHKTDAKTEASVAVNTLAYAGTQTPTPQENAMQPAGVVSSFTVAQSQAVQRIQQDARLARQLIQKIHHALPNMKDIEVHQQMRGVVISLKDNILFTPGSADLTPEANRTLSHLIQQLHTALGGQPRPIRVEGHTDNTPIANSKFPSNWELSTARATTIVRYLLASHQFQPQMLSAAGYGEFKPLKDNSSIEGKQKNRRVDIVVLRPDMAEDMSPDLTESNDSTLSKSTSKSIGSEQGQSQ